MNNVLAAVCDQGKKPLILARRGADNSSESEHLSGLIFEHSPDIFFRPGPLAFTGSMNRMRIIDSRQAEELRGQCCSEVLYTGAAFRISPSRTGLIITDCRPEHYQELLEVTNLLECAGAVTAWILKLDQISGLKSSRTQHGSIPSLCREVNPVPYFHVLGPSPAMTAVRQAIERAAPTRAPVLLTGEPGTGRSVLATVLHSHSPRQSSPLISIDCSSLSRDSLELMLFGIRPGLPEADTGCFQGLPESGRGTLYLSEVQALPQPLQKRLLCFFSARRLEKGHESKDRGSDIRIIASSSCDLAREVHEKRFLEELYFRLNVFPVRVPPVRERKEDIPLLLNSFTAAAAGPGNSRLVFSPKCLDLLVHHGWPGNLREMEHLVHKLYLTVPGKQVDLHDLPESISAANLNESAQSRSCITLEELEKQEVLGALDRNGWVQARAARELGISQRQMGYRVAKFGLREEVSRFRQLVHR